MDIEIAEFWRKIRWLYYILFHSSHSLDFLVLQILPFKTILLVILHMYLSYFIYSYIYMNSSPIQVNLRLAIWKFLQACISFQVKTISKLIQFVILYVIYRERLTCGTWGCGRWRGRRRPRLEPSSTWQQPANTRLYIYIYWARTPCTVQYS